MTQDAHLNTEVGMRTAHMIRDKEKLFSMLFMSPTLTTRQIPPLLVSPHFLTLLLHEAEGIDYASQYELLCEILDIFVMKPINWLLLWHHDAMMSQNEQSIIETIVHWFCRLTRKQEDIKYFVGCLRSSLCYYEVGVKTISKITQMLSRDFQSEEFSCLRAMLCHSILEIYLSPKTNLLWCPSDFFFFYGRNSNSAIRSVRRLDNVLPNELSVVIVFCLQEHCGKILQIKTTHDTLVIRANGHVSIANESTRLQLVDEDYPLALDIWHRLIVNFTTTATTAFLAEEELFKDVPLIKLDKERRIEEVVIGEDLFGFVSNCFLASTTILPDRLPMKDYAQGASDWQRVLRLKEHKLSNNLLAGCFPFSRFQQRYQQYCFDPFRKNHFSIGDNIIVVHHYSPACGINYIGGYDSILPLFYLARFYDPHLYPDQLERLLRLLLTMVEHYKETDVLEKNSVYLMIIGHHLSALAAFITPHCLHLLAQIESRLSVQNKIIFVRYVLWGSHLAKIKDPVLLQSYYTLIIKKYQNAKPVALKAFGLLDVLFWALHNLEKSSTDCCLQHYISEFVVYQDFSIHQAMTADSELISLHYANIETIGTIILESVLLDSEANEKATETVKSMLRLLLQRHSNCFYLTLVRIVKRQLGRGKMDPNLIRTLSRYCDIEAFLGVLSEKSVSPCILTEIVYVVLYTSQIAKESRLLEVHDFIVTLLARLQDYSKHSFSYFKCGTSKIRRRSMDCGVLDTPTMDFIAKLKTKASFNCLGDLAVILMNYSLGVVMEGETTSKNCRFQSEEGMRLLYHFQSFANKDTKRLILSFLMSQLESSQDSYDFCCSSLHLHMIVEDCLQRELPPALHILARRLYYVLLSYQLRKEGSFEDYYIFLRQTGQQDLVKVEILGQVIKEGSLLQQHLCTLLLILEFEYISGPMPQKLRVLNEIHDQLILQIKLTVENRYFKTFTGNKNDPMSLVEHVVKDSGKQALQLFEGCFGEVPVEEVTFLFDILLPKILGGVQVKEILTKGIAKTTEIFEIYFYSLIRRIRVSADETGSLLSTLVEITLLYAGVHISRGNAFLNKSNLRMLIFFLTAFLLERKKQSLFASALLKMWQFLVQFLAGYGKVCEADNYSRLMEQLKARNIHYCLVEIFSIFLCKENGEELVSLQRLKTMKREQIMELVLSQHFEKTIQLKDNTLFLLQFCISKKDKDIQRYFQQKLKTLGERKESRKNTNAFFRSIQRIVDSESIPEEETRQRNFHEHECVIRRYYSQWQRIWDRQRLFDSLYGTWLAQKDDINKFQLDEKDKMFKNFIFRMSQYSSRSGIYPVLETRIIEPWHVVKVLGAAKRDKQKVLIEMLRPTQSKPKKGFENGKSITGLWKLLTLRQKGTSQKQYNVIWVNGGVKARGHVSINDSAQIIFWYESIRQEDSHLAFEKFSLPFDEELVKVWRIEMVQKVCLRRYLMKYAALEFIMATAKSVWLCFEGEEVKHFLSQLLKARTKLLQEHGQKLKLNRVPLVNEDWYAQLSLDPEVTERWRSRKISTLCYLMHVNQAASRGVYDLSQYPVFPWIAEMTDERQPHLRDLTKTLAGLGSAQRRAQLREKFLGRDPFNPVPPFFFGTHYSSPGVVFNFLIRLSPFTEYCKNLQGGKFDIPDRLFSSFLGSWKSACTEMSDARELIPEFYYLPECLLNLERHNYGLTQTKEVVDNVELPPWAAGNPYFFVLQLRQMLESDETSATIGKWIDLFFGCKQRGEEAEANYNIYYYLTYEDQKVEEQDDVHSRSCEAQIVHFGQTPPQLFSQPHPSRELAQHLPSQLHPKLRIQLPTRPNEEIFGLTVSDTEVLVVRRSEFQSFTVQKSVAVMARAVPLNLQKSKNESVYLLKKLDARVVFFRKHYFLVYGYLNNDFRIYNQSSGVIDESDTVDSQISVLLLNERQDMVLVGCQSGMLHCYELQYGNHKVSAKKVHVEVFQSTVNHISEHDGFLAISYGCFVAIYKIERSLHYLTEEGVRPFVKFFRSFKNPIPVKGALIVDSPLYSLVLYDNANIRVYSINGQLIRSCSCNAKTICRIVDAEMNHFLLLIEEERLLCLSTPDLRCISELEVRNVVDSFGNLLVFANQIWQVHCF